MSRRELSKEQCLDTLRQMTQEDENIVDWWNPAETSESELNAEIADAKHELEEAKDNLDALEFIKKVRVWYKNWTDEDLAYIAGETDRNPCSRIAS